MNRFLDTIETVFTSGENKNIVIITETDKKRLLTSIRRKIIKNEGLKPITHIQDNTIITDNENTNTIYVFTPGPQNEHQVFDISDLFYYKPSEYKPHKYFVTSVSYIPHTKNTKQYVVDTEENHEHIQNLGFVHEKLIP